MKEKELSKKEEMNKAKVTFEREKELAVMQERVNSQVSHYFLVIHTIFFPS